MKITLELEHLPLNEFQKAELIKALQSVAELITDAYDAGYSKGFDEGCDL